MKFLQNVDARIAIHELLRRPGPVNAAVAYWGHGAIDNLGIEHGQDLSVVCDVLSGGCNEDEIARLLDVLGTERVRTLEGLHSKVWLAPDSALLGSSNASSNGLGFEGRETEPLVEANVIVDEPGLLSAIRQWWAHEVWGKARPIDGRDLERARALRSIRRAVRPLSQFVDLADGLSRDPDAFADRGLHVWVFEYQGYDSWVRQALRQVQAKFGDGSLACWQDVDPLPEGSVVIEFNSQKSPPMFTGMYRVLGHHQPARTGAGSLLLCAKVDNFAGLALGAEGAWEEAAARAAATGGDAWDAAEFGRKFFR